MKVLNIWQERENIFAFSHFCLGIITYLIFGRMLAVIIVAVLWEVIVDVLRAGDGLIAGIADHRGFSFGDIIWAIVGGCATWGWICL